LAVNIELFQAGQLQKNKLKFYFKKNTRGTKMDRMDTGCDSGAIDIGTNPSEPTGECGRGYRDLARLLSES